MRVFVGRPEGCGYRSGEGRRAGRILTARMRPAERSGGGRGGYCKTGHCHHTTYTNEVVFMLEVVCFGL